MEAYLGNIRELEASPRMGGGAVGGKGFLCIWVAWVRLVRSGQVRLVLGRLL